MTDQGSVTALCHSNKRLHPTPQQYVSVHLKNHEDGISTKGQYASDYLISHVGNVE